MEMEMNAGPGCVFGTLFASFHTVLLLKEDRKCSGEAQEFFFVFYYIEEN